MKKVNRWIVRNTFASALAAVLWSGSSAVAAADFTADFLPGQACAFALHVEGTGGNQVYRDFVDRNGNLIRSLSAGSGSALTFTNLSTGAKFSTQSNGAVTHITYNADGSYTYVTTGHNILILFPTDVPAGPTTTLYVGRVVFTVDSSFNYDLVQHNGTATDICATLS